MSQFKRAGGELRIFSASERVRSVLKMVRLESILVISENKVSTLSQCRPRKSRPATEGSSKAEAPHFCLHDRSVIVGLRVEDPDFDQNFIHVHQGIWYGQDQN